MKRQILFFVFLSVFLIAAFLLLRGSSLLLLSLSGAASVPLGTFITWIGMIAFPAAIYFGIAGFHPPQSAFFARYRMILLGILLLAGSWGLVSYGLAGNWTYSFSERAPGFRGSTEASVYFWRFSYFTVLLPLFFLLVMGIHFLIRKICR